MCKDSDLRAQARATSRDVMRVMGGGVFVLGLISLAVAMSIELDRHQIEPFRAVMNLAMMVIILSGFVWIVASFSRRLERVEQAVASFNGAADDQTVALIKGRRF